MRENFGKYKDLFGVRNAIIGGLIKEKIIIFLTNYKAGLIFPDIDFGVIRSTDYPAPNFLHFEKQPKTIGLEERLKPIIASLGPKDGSTFAIPQAGENSNKITIVKPSENDPSFDILCLRKMGS